MIDDKVREILLKHDYCVNVIEVEPDYITLRIPKNQFYSESFFNYGIGPDPGFFIGDSKNEEPAFVVCPFYTVRPLIQQHIEKLCKKIHYSSKFIFYYNHKGEIISSLPLSPPREEEDYKKESVLNNIFIRAKQENFPPDYLQMAVSEKVEVGYGMLYNLAVVK